MKNSREFLTWVRDLFIIRHTNKTPFAREVFLGNGKLGAMFDYSSFNTRDYIYCKGIRKENNFAGLFWTYFDIAYPGGPNCNGQHWDWEQTLNMYEGILQTRFRRQGKATTFFHIKKDLIIFDFERCSETQEPTSLTHDDLTFGITTAKRGGKYADIISRKVKLINKKLAIIDLKIKGNCTGWDKKKFPHMHCGNVFQDVNWSIQIAIGLSGDGELSNDSNGIEVCLGGKGCTIFTCFDAKRNGVPEALKMLREVLRRGYKRVKEEHTSGWHRFWDKCMVDIPDKELLKLYISSLYILRANYEEKGIYSNLSTLIGSITSSYGWDDVGPHDAFLSTNHPEVAESIVNFWDSCKELGRKVQKSISPNSKGISLAPVNFEPFYYRLPPRLNRDFFHIFPGIEACRQFEYTNDRKYLNKYFSLIQGIAEMLETYALIPSDTHGGLEVRPCQPVDETYGFVGIKNPMMGAAMAKSFLRLAGRAAGFLGKRTLADKWLSLSDRILLPENDRYYLNNPLMTDADIEKRFSGETMIIFFPAMLIPDRAKAERTYELYTTKSTSRFGLGIINGANVHNWVASFPSCHFIHGSLPAAMLERGEDVLEMLQVAKRFAMEWGTFPECIRSDDEGLIMTPEYLFPSAGYIQTINAMFIQGDEQQIRIFPAIPQQWFEKSLGFKLRSMPGVVVEVSYQPDKQVMYFRAEVAKEIDVDIRLKDDIQILRYMGKPLSKTNSYFKLSLSTGVHKIELKWE